MSPDVKAATRRLPNRDVGDQRNGQGSHVNGLNDRASLAFGESNHPDEAASSESPSFPAEWTPLASAYAADDSRERLFRAIRRELALLCLVAVMAVLYFAQDVLIPIALALVLSLLLRPPVRWLSRRHVPQVVGTLLCLAAVLAVIVVVILPLLAPAAEWIENFPEHLHQASRKLQGVRERLEQWVRLRSQIEELATSTEATPPVPVTLERPTLSRSAGMLTATGAMAGAGLVVVVLTFFLLIEGDSLLNSTLKILPTFHQKRHTVELIREIESGVSSYLGTVTLINIGLGLAIALALWLLGVPNPLLWGLMTTIFNYVPFLGQAVAGIIISLVALLSFDSFGYAMLAPVVFYSIAALEGNVITPSLVGHRMSLNPILVIVSLLVWGWMWGIAGAALAVPILAMLKIACNHFELTTPATGGAKG